MIRFKRSIDIRAEPHAVFELVIDLQRRLDLNTDIKVIRVVKETDGPVDVDTIFHIQLTSQGQPIKYRCRCTAFEAGRLFETVSLTDRPFGMRVTLEPIPEGTRLTQEEWLTVEYEKLSQAEDKSVLGELAGSLASGLSGHTSEDQRFHNAKLEAQLSQELKQWLKKTKASLENH